MKKIILLTAVAALSACLVGCGNPNFTSDSIPKEKFLVGGGFEVKYKAPAAGTVFLVEESSKKIIKTETLEEDEEYSLSSLYSEDEFISQILDPVDEDTIEALKKIGINPERLKLKLYFIPAASVNK